jgi:hypothetical protein
LRPSLMPTPGSRLAHAPHTGRDDNPERRKAPAHRRRPCQRMRSPWPGFRFGDRTEYGTI